MKQPINLCIQIITLPKEFLLCLLCILEGLRRAGPTIDFDPTGSILQSKPCQFFDKKNAKAMVFDNK